MMVSLPAARCSYGVAADTTYSHPTGGAAVGSRPSAPHPYPLRGGDRPRNGGQPHVGDPVEAAVGTRRAAEPPAETVVRSAVPLEPGPVAPPAGPAPAGCRRGWVRDRAMDAPADCPGDRADLRGAVPPPLARPGLARPRLESAAP